ncbi:hypothetical protein OG777_14365 [Micromonospora peucetia]|uniref:XRE family transcriptional regulator n=1 Tax=Micromonospora peucetia TaxID=47871 RepID=A0A1C6VUX9_9ACTN|nr:hypothetical protein [Micromonospora peucetia]MCX4388109.1 hypothetical protein [Micromonospora peucetia]WSA31210.1 hypothetical protein OIE14_24145 [Micromonospora peucetia]SCL70032.1 hypothetical protein GA0070608_4210 [Micromonospora peucetia]
MDRELAAVLRSGPFHVALRAAIQSHGLALQRIQHRLDQFGVHVSLGTLSYWQSGRRRPERPASLRAVTALEEILGLPANSLIVLLGPPRPRGPAAGLPPGARRYADVVDAPGPLAALLDDLDGPDGRLHILSSFDSIMIGAGRDGRRYEHVQVLAAHQDTDRHVTIYQGDPGCDIGLVSFTALDNCRLGRIRRDPQAGLLVAELLFDRMLRVGETQILRYHITDASGVPGTGYSRAFRFPVHQAVLQVRFDPDALPVRCWRFVRRSATGADDECEEMTLGPHHDTHFVRTGVMPGVIGLRWEWD